MNVNVVRHIRTCLVILSLDTIIIPWDGCGGMKQHALRTAMTLYQGGTLELDDAARQAGVSPDRLRRAVDRLGGAVPTPTTETERTPVHAD
jgi:hypothetical protein